VSVIIGSAVYGPVVERYRKPCVIAGFEAMQIMEGIVHLARQVRDGAGRLENLYPEAVTDDGNAIAKAMIEEVFEPGDSAWRALGVMEKSGLDVREEYGAFDAFRKFDLVLGEDHELGGCRCGEVITGRCDPTDCRLFGTICTPIYPVGPCMVSSEGSCQAWFKYRRHEMKS